MSVDFRTCMNFDSDHAINVASDKKQVTMGMDDSDSMYVHGEVHPRLALAPV